MSLYNICISEVSVFVGSKIQSFLSMDYSINLLLLMFFRLIMMQN